MKSNSMITKAACLMLMASATTSAFAQKMNIEHKGDTTIIKVENPTKYLLLPIQEEKDEAKGIKNQIMTGSYLRPFTVEFTASLKF